MGRVMRIEDRLQSLKLSSQSLEKRRNRQELIAVFKMSEGVTRLRLQECLHITE